MKTMKAWVALALLLLLPLQASAADRKEGTGPANPNDPGNATIIGAYNGTKWMQVRIDENGNLLMVDGKPRELQAFRSPLSDTTSTVINGVLRPVGVGWSISPFGDRTAHLTIVTKGTPTTIKLYLFTSDDDVMYTPFISSDAWSYANNDGDSLKVDTLKVTIPTNMQNASTVRQMRIALPQLSYPGKYAQFWATRTDSTGGSNPRIHLGIMGEGRHK